MKQVILNYPGLEKIIIEKDRHIKDSQPFFNAHQDYNKWYLENPELNNDKALFISLGDFFDKSTPTPEEYGVANEFFHGAKFKSILLQGNHDYNRTIDQSSTEPLKSFPGVSLIKEPTQLVINGIKFLMLPFFYETQETSMREVYSNIPEEFQKNNYIIYHFEDETVSFGGAGKIGINLSYLKGERVGGHIHLIQENYELGMPVNSRYDERGQDNFLYCISLKKEFTPYIPIPKFIDYYDVKNPDPLPVVDAKYPIWDIHDVKNKHEVNKVYGRGIHVRKMHKPIVEELVKASGEVIENKDLTLITYFDMMIKEKGLKLSNKIFTKIHEILSRKQEVTIES